MPEKTDGTVSLVVLQDSFLHVWCAKSGSQKVLCLGAEWDLGQANITTSQIKTVAAAGRTQRCLKFIGGFEATGLYLDECDTEPAICAQTRCASS